MLTRTLTTALAAAALLACALPAHAGLVSSMEGAMSGWSAVAGTGTTISASTTGVTDGTQAMKITTTDTNWAVHANYADTANILASLRGNGLLSIDVTAFSADVPAGWLNLVFIINSDATGFVQADHTASYQQAVPLDGQSHTITWDYSAVEPSIPATAPWAQIGLVTQSTTAPYTLYVDNLRSSAVPEPASLGLLGLGALALLRRRH